MLPVVRWQEMIVSALGVFDLTPSVHENDAESDRAEHLKSLNNETGDSQTVSSLIISHLDMQKIANSDFTKSGKRRVDFNERLPFPKADSTRSSSR